MLELSRGVEDEDLGFWEEENVGSFDLIVRGWSEAVVTEVPVVVLAELSRR